MTTRNVKQRPSKRGHGTLGKSMRKRGGLGRRIWRGLLRALVAGVRDVHREVQQARGTAGKGRPARKGTDPLKTAQRLQGGQRKGGGGLGGGAKGDPQPPDWDDIAHRYGWGPAARPGEAEAAEAEAEAAEAEAEAAAAEDPSGVAGGAV